MKRFVLCLDGTWNNAASEAERADGSKVFKPTNVLKLARATCKRSEVGEDGTEGVLQVTYYDAGVGAMNRAVNFRTKIIRFADNKLGGGWGAGFEVNVEEAFSFLTNNYAPGDEVFIFGFSRGAAQARSLVRLLDWVGGVPEKADSYYVPKLFTRFLEQQGEGSGQAYWDELNAKRKSEGRTLLKPIIPTPIKFLGVWDTVLALGLRFRAKGGSSHPKHRFHTPNTLPTNVERVRHALAIDERRHDFQPDVWQSTGASAAMEQRWFPGVHSNVGGGLLRDGLANGALRWMCDEAQDAGLALDTEFLKYYRPYATDEASKKSKGFKIGDALLRPFRGFAGERKLAAAPGMTLDETVFTRLNADAAEHDRLPEAYRSRHLLQFLADNPQFDPHLEPEALATVERLR